MVSVEVEAGLVPLESGDRLTRGEFERRYTCRPDIKKAELIEGVVYVASPVRIRKHARPHIRMAAWLVVYESRTPGTISADNGTVRLDLDNEPQPDAFLAWDEEHGGEARLDDNDYLDGAPELVVEVAASSAAYDLHDKLRAYRRNGVREYIVWQILEERIDWFELKDGEYAAVAPDERGVIESKVFPGLRLAVAEMLAGNIGAVLAELQRDSN
ncbi:MAG: Uma2 family endonuclease [Chloroflexi bacterium]|nr:Uma2 family endonuclease [Chloroflexota bacterium]